MDRLDLEEEEVEQPTDKEGLFVYRARRALYIRSLPNITDESRTTRSISKDELVAVDKCLANRDPDSKDGAFLRLTCNGGWLFEFKKGAQEMFRVRVRNGLWAYRVENEGVGLSLRQHPSQRSDLKFMPERRFHDGCIVFADKKVFYEGVNYLRVQGTSGWLFDLRNGNETLVRLDKKTLEKEGCSPSVLTVKELLDVAEIRHMAIEHGYAEVQHDDIIQVLGFVKHVVVPAGEKATTPVVRINVYYQSASIQTQIHHPYHHAHDKTTSLYKLDCTHTELWDIFANPYGTDKWHYKGWKLESGNPESGPHPKGNKPEEAIGMETASSEETTLRKACVDLDAQIKFLSEQRDAVLEGVKAFESKREDFLTKRYVSAQQREEARLEADALAIEEDFRKRRGDNVSLFCNHADVVTDNFNPEVVFMTMAGTATLFLYENGNWSYTAGLPTPMHKRLHKRSRSDPRPTVVAIGPHHRYYVEFANGKSYWEGLSEEFDEAVRSTNHIVKVAFGQWDTSFFLLEKSGATQYIDLPQDLTEHLQTSLKKVQNVSLGPAGEWYVSWTDGSWRCDNVSAHMTEKINKLQKKGWHVRDMAFGEGATYIIRYGTIGGKFTGHQA
eukprot:CAMPEP_0198219562 /NCGR_PEP_ID=MMETSP1445-20131203/74947_1 /TAXON_ID=36898 /ORGANISM="Pyramimonas sp., Strain CCMP2087" /LENGTH=612 /DNA_ID=CAMNT_0043897007 /DNA_START=128 /DNA_END=1966 /DNA_ORIENTATION=+